MATYYKNLSKGSGGGGGGKTKPIDLGEWDIPTPDMDDTKKPTTQTPTQAQSMLAAANLIKNLTPLSSNNQIAQKNDKLVQYIDSWTTEAAGAVANALKNGEIGQAEAKMAVETIEAKANQAFIDNLYNMSNGTNVSNLAKSTGIDQKVLDLMNGPQLSVQKTPQLT